jgi:thiamine monophosphate kinase
VLGGGEDFELLLTLPEDAVGAAVETVGPTPLTVIGHIQQADFGVVLETEGRKLVPLSPLGWKHF